MFANHNDYILKEMSNYSSLVLMLNDHTRHPSGDQDALSLIQV
jgi:hypothetical protein